MPCNNCFNGCSEIISDDCIKYTGNDIPSLNIVSGDSLSSVEAAISTYLISALNGTGIVPVIDPLILCPIVQGYLPVSGDITIVHIVSALIQSVCSLQEQITTNTNSITTLNADYIIGCLEGVLTTSDTHDILQATINKLCAVSANLGALTLEIATNYVSIADIDSYIETYLSSVGATTLISAKMVPFTAVEYYGDLAQFDVTGAGTGDWLKIYLCNGNNGTPDKRGRVSVGTTSGMGGGVFNPAVDPAIAGNPAYSLYTKTGANNIILDNTQLPSHTHSGSTDTIGAHTHSYTQYALDQEVAETGSGVRSLNKNNTQSGVFTTAASGAHSHGLTINSTGGGLGHPNIQPVIACHYIIYIP